MCSTRREREFIPDEGDVMSKFPHLPSGLYKDASDGGYPLCPQPLLYREGKKTLSDRIVGSKFCILTKTKSLN